MLTGSESPENRREIYYRVVLSSASNFYLYTWQDGREGRSKGLQPGVSHYPQLGYYSRVEQNKQLVILFTDGAIQFQDSNQNLNVLPKDEDDGDGDGFLEEDELSVIEDAGLIVRGVFALENTNLKSSGLTPSRLEIFSKLDGSTESPDSGKWQV